MSQFFGSLVVLAAFAGMSAHASVPNVSANSEVGRIGAVIVTDATTGQQCLVNTDSSPIKAISAPGKASVVGDFQGAVALTGGQIPACSAEMNAWASEASQVSYLNAGPKVAASLQLTGAAAIASAAISYYFACSMMDSQTTIAGEFYRANAQNPNSTANASSLVGAKISSVVGGALTYTVCIGAWLPNQILSHVFIK